MHGAHETDGFALTQNNRLMPVADVDLVGLVADRGENLKRLPAVAAACHHLAARCLDKRNTAGDVPDVRPLEGRDAEKTGGNKGAFAAGRSGLPDFERMGRALNEARLSGQS